MLSLFARARVGCQLTPVGISFRTFQTSALLQKDDKTPTHPNIRQAPGPMPLGDSNEQKKIEDMIKDANIQNAPPPGLTPEELEKFYEPVVDESDSLRPFLDNTNPKTGEVNGPRGPEPTRFGDWERKGRVSDF